MQRRFLNNLKEKDLLPIIDCKLTNDMGDNVSCTLLSNVRILGDHGVVHGYIKIKDIDLIQNLLRAMHSADEGWFKNIDNIPHTYADSNKRSGIRLDISNFTFYNIVLNRFKNSENVFHFMARILISDIKKFAEIIKKGGKEIGKKNPRRLERGSRKNGGATSYSKSNA